MKKVAILLLFFFSVTISPVYAQQQKNSCSYNPHGLKEQEGFSQGGHYRKKKNSRFKHWIKKEMPEFYTQLEKLRKEDPELFNKFNQQIRRERSFKQLCGSKKKTTSETKNLINNLLNNELSSLKLAKQYQASQSTEEQEKIKTDIMTILNKSFELKEKKQLKVIERMEERIKTVKELITKRKNMKDEIVAQRLAEITGEQEEIQW